MTVLPRSLATPAESHVLLLLLEGCSNREIASRLVLSPRTVERHISSLLSKTGCRSRTQLLLWTLGAISSGREAPKPA